jgi:protein SCO1
VKPLRVLVVAVAALVASCGAPASDRPASPLQGLAFEQRLDAALPGDVPLVDDAGRSVTLCGLLGGRPCVMAFVYYRCPRLCPMLEEGLVRGLRGVALVPGRDFEVVLVSIDPAEGPEVASDSKRRCLARYGRAGTEAGWHFLTGTGDAVRRLADAAGFGYRFDAATGQYAHAAGVLVLTPDAKVARCLFGIDFPSTDLRLALVEASQRRIGTPIDAVLLYCLCWDPATGRYGPAVMNLLRLGGAATVIGLGVLLLRMSRRTRRREVAEAVA